jgi:NDP-sugar pyrophosphorylase family protein
MDTLIKKLLKDDVPVTKYDLKEYWLDIGRLNDYEQAQEIYQTYFSAEE